MTDDRLGLFGARALGLARETRVGGLERRHVDRGGARRQPPEGQLGAPEQVLPLPHGDRRQQPRALAPREPPVGPPCPGEPAEAVGVGWVHGRIKDSERLCSDDVDSNALTNSKRTM
jgi:hypothetical protein